MFPLQKLKKRSMLVGGGGGWLFLQKKGMYRWGGVRDVTSQKNVCVQWETRRAIRPTTQTLSSIPCLLKKKIRRKKISFARGNEAKAYLAFHTKDNKSPKR